MKILSYKIFKNNNDFEKWQLEHMEKDIAGVVQVQPIVATLEMKGLENKTGETNDIHMEGSINVAIFVTYLRKDNER